MTVSIFDLFSIGVGPSSSHTVGPMEAGADFAEALRDKGLLEKTTGLGVDLFGSLAATGQGHGTFGAVLLGLDGHRPRSIRPDTVESRLAEIADGSPLRLGGDGPEIRFGIDDLTLRPLTFLPRHSNAMTFRALDADGTVLYERTSYSIGGGFVVHDEDPTGENADTPAGAELPTVPDDAPQIPYPFHTGEELLEHCHREGLSIAEIALANESALRPRDEVIAGVLELWDVMEECKNNSLTRTGALPGGLNTRRRAPAWHKRLTAADPDFNDEHWIEWVNLVALAVNEENATGGRIVTAPTNGAAGIIPAAIFYANHYTPRAREGGREARPGIVIDFLLAASAIGSCIKEQASISGAEVGCQGEVGSAAAMAAAGIAQVLGGTPQQVSNAAEIAMEHHLGLTCDPVGGLVQVPCIERNAIAAGTAVNAARMALFEDSEAAVSLDVVIKTMKETGDDMSTKYKETALGGLAVNVVAC